MPPAIEGGLILFTDDSTLSWLALKRSINSILNAEQVLLPELAPLLLQMPKAGSGGHIPSGTVGVTVQSGVPATSSHPHRGQHVIVSQVCLLAHCQPGVYPPCAAVAGVGAFAVGGP